eukprot:gnl/Dysnectes_brevis/3055_a3785_1649.p1 GENE.gnl/Dysnectes_brevis/3055_a3785_1649~~gnl/Dysnectes_brevis/3055_a3785_1649.p1  ORF type:complete len:267 (+),score=33.81 gnl/Dysnectes_brevis/3055_a3785_1649:88-888(+)
MPSEFICPVCEKSFNRQGKLTDHMPVHTGERPFPCSECPKTFKRKAHLDRHVRSAHRKVKAFECDFDGCDKTFATRQHLNRHMKTHDKPSPFTCSFCAAPFKKKQHLTTHVLRSHISLFAKLTAHANAEGETVSYSLDHPHPTLTPGELASRLILESRRCPCGKEFRYPSYLKLHILVTHTLLATWLYGIQDPQRARREHLAAKSRPASRATSPIPDEDGVIRPLFKDKTKSSRLVFMACSRCGRTFRTADALEKHQSSCTISIDE